LRCGRRGEAWRCGGVSWSWISHASCATGASSCSRHLQPHPPHVYTTMCPHTELARAHQGRPHAACGVRHHDRASLPGRVPTGVVASGGIPADGVPPRAQRGSAGHGVPRCGVDSPAVAASDCLPAPRPRLWARGTHRPPSPCPRFAHLLFPPVTGVCAPARRPVPRPWQPPAPQRGVAAGGQRACRVAVPVPGAVPGPAPAAVHLPEHLRQRGGARRRRRRHVPAPQRHD
jgi:hypothetical protein